MSGVSMMRHQFQTRHVKLKQDVVKETIKTGKYSVKPGLEPELSRSKPL